MPFALLFGWAGWKPSRILEGRIEQDDKRIGRISVLQLPLWKSPWIGSTFHPNWRSQLLPRWVLSTRLSYSRLWKATPFPCFFGSRVLTVVTGPRLPPSTTLKNIPFNNPFLNYAIWSMSPFPARTLAGRNKGRQYTCYIPHHNYVAWIMHYKST